MAAIKHYFLFVISMTNLHNISLLSLSLSPQPTNFSNPVYDSLYNDRRSAGSQGSLPQPDDDEKKELIDFGDDDDAMNFDTNEKTAILT